MSSGNTLYEYEMSMEPQWREDAKRAYEWVKRIRGSVIKGNLPDMVIPEEEIAEIIGGSVDIHVHAWPYPLVQAGWDKIEISKRACDAGMGAIVFKSHVTPTAPIAPYVQRIVNDYAESTGRKAVKVFGGITLNYAVGGLNPEAVEICAKFGGKVVWLPSHDAEHHRKVIGESGGIGLLREAGGIRPELVDILEIVARNGMILDPCHTSTRERFAVIDEAKRRGVERIIVTHPNWNVTKATLEQQVEMAKKGAYIGLFLYGAIPSFNNPNCDPLEMMRIIREVGPERVVIASDLGSVLNIHPVEGMRLAVRLLLVCGIKRRDIERMIKKNPSELLGMQALS